MTVFLCEVAAAGCDQGEAGGGHGQCITERDQALSGWLRVTSLGEGSSVLRDSCSWAWFAEEECYVGPGDG